MSEAINFTNLYLLEFFIETAKFENLETISSESYDGKIKLCLSFQFLHYPVMEICEEKILVHNNATDVVFKQGKSCLFASRAIDSPSSKEFEVKIVVSQRNAEAEEFSGRKNIGETSVKLGRDFLKGKATRGDFPLRSGSGEIIGYLNVFLSLTSWGKQIMTRFQSGSGNPDSFMFKGMETVPVKETEEICIPKEINENVEGEYTETFIGDGGRDLAENISAYREVTDSIDSTESDDNSMVESTEESGVTNEQAEEETSVTADKNYKEIEVNINNHFLRLKVIRNKNNKIILDSCGDGVNEVEQTCNTGSLVSDEDSTKPSSKDLKQDAGVVQIKGDRILMEMPTEPTPMPDNPTYRFKAGKEIDANIVRFSQSAETGIEFGKADRLQETFLMVVKNNRHTPKAENSSRLDLELRTPKRPEQKPAAEEKITQYDIRDLPPGSAKSKPQKQKGQGKDKKKK